MKSSDFYENIKKEFTSDDISKASEESRRQHAKNHERRHGIKSLPEIIRGLK